MKPQTAIKIESLLRQLADGEFHSGEALAQQIGVSRTAIWKLIQKLESWGLEVYSVRGRGYRIPGGLELLQQSEISEALSQSGCQFDLVEVLTSIDSTADYVARQWSQSPGQSRVCVAEHQSKGRGRKGRAWISPFAANLYFSVGVALPMGLSALGGLSLAVGMMMAERLNQYCKAPVKIKWPNDLLSQGQKLAGILVEASGDSNDTSFLNIGVGINWAMQPQQAQPIDQPWTNLENLMTRQVTRSALLVDLLVTLDRTLKTYQNQGFSGFSARWPELSAYYGKPVKLNLPKQEVSGKEVGIEDNGALRIETADGLRVFHSGEISMRPE